MITFQKGLFPSDTQYSLANVILYDDLHFKEISLDAKNSHGNHLYDGMNAPVNRIQNIKMDDPISKHAFRYKILELWYVKVKLHLLNQDLHLYPPL